MKPNYEAEMTRLEDAARRQTAIGEMAHAGRNGSRRSDWVDAAHYAMTKRPLWAHRLYKGRGVKWRDVYRAAKQVNAGKALAVEPAAPID